MRKPLGLRNTLGGGASQGYGVQNDVFQEADVCGDLQLVMPHQRCVVKKGRQEHASFALLSSPLSSGVSEWKLRIEQQRGIIFLGVLLEERLPRDGLARKLITPAWMTSSYGYVCTTGGIRGQESHTEAAKAEAGAAKPGALSFEAGDEVTIRLDRDAGTVSFQVCL